MIVPNDDEVRKWLLESVRHSCMVEFYLHALDLGSHDPQRPHDITGKGSKLSWPVVMGLALQYRSDDPVFFESYVLPSIEYHRKNQYHHQMWNGPDPDASDEDMKVGAIDSLCSMRDCRAYQGGEHSFEEVIHRIKDNEPERMKWFWMVYSMMKQVDAPDFSVIVSIYNLPSLGLPDDMHRRIQYQVDDSVRVLRHMHGFDV